jgi:hypothetical protein
MATTTTSTRSAETETRPSNRITAARAVVTDAATTAGSLATEAASRLPAAAAATRATYDDANRRIRSSSDEMLRLGTAMSFGFAVGLLVAGASRLLVALAMLPVGMVGLAMLERWGGAAARSGMQDG